MIERRGVPQEGVQYVAKRLKPISPHTTYPACLLSSKIHGRLWVLLLQANKSAVIASKEGHYPAITAEEFVRDSLAAIYVKQEE